MVFSVTILFFHYFKDVAPFSSYCVDSDEKSSVIFFVYKVSPQLQAAFKTFSLALILSNLITMCLDVHFFVCCAWGLLSFLYLGADSFHQI